MMTKPDSFTLSRTGQIESNDNMPTANQIWFGWRRWCIHDPGLTCGEREFTKDPFKPRGQREKSQ